MLLLHSQLNMSLSLAAAAAQADKQARMAAAAVVVAIFQVSLEKALAVAHLPFLQWALLQA